MTIEHVSISDPEIHEPKGVSTANIKEVYQADGVGSGSWTNIVTDVVIVRSAADLPTPVLVDGVLSHIPENKEYIINNDITITNPIAYPGAGNMARFTAVNRAVVTYSGTDQLFRDTDAEGKIEVDGLTEWRAPNGNFFNLVASTGSWSFQTKGGKFTNCNNIGTLDGGASANGEFNMFFGVLSDFDQGLVATDLSFFEINTMFCFGNNQPGCTYFTVQGTNATGSINFFTNTFSNASNETLFNINPNVNPGVESVNFIANHEEGGIFGTIFDAASLDTDDPFVYSAGNDGVMKDTRPDALLSLTNNATNTVIAAVDTPVLVAGTWNIERTSQMTGTAAGRATLNTARNVVAPLTARVSIEPVSGTNKDISVYIAKNGVIIANSKATARVSSGSPQSVTVVWQDELTQDDYIEVWVENNTDAVDLLISAAINRVN